MKPLKTTVTGLLAAGLLVTSVSATYSVGGGYTTDSNVNLRSEASTGASVIDTLDENEYFVVTGTSGDWYEVDYHGVTGYISSEYSSYSQIIEGDFGNAYVNGNYVRMRSEPNTSSSVLGMYNYGVEMSVIGVSADWYKVNYNGVTGYIRSDLMKLKDTPERIGTGTVTGSYVRMRTGPGTNYSIITTFAKGTSVIVNGQSGSWYMISYNGMNGYISASYLSVVYDETEEPSEDNSSDDATNDNSSDDVPVGDTSSDDSSTGDTGSDNTPSEKTGTVTGNDVRIRSGPGTSYSVISYLSKGAKVKILDDSNSSWYKISCGSYTGYMSSTYISINSTETDSSEGSSEDNTEEQKGIVTGSAVRLRSGPGTSHSIYTSLNYGNIVKILGAEGDWYKVDYNGTVGYMHSDYIRVVTENSSSNDMGEYMASLAMNYLGCPYVYGASGPSSFDCSGFMYYLFARLNGISIPRCAAPQATVGIAVSKSELQVGDLVFFDNDGNPHGYVDADHVGIYIGDGQFIHASSGAGKVVISSLSNSYYITHWYCARRVIGYV